MSQDSFLQRLCRGVRRLRQRADWARLLGTGWPDHIMQAPVTDRFHAKQGRSTGRLIVERQGARLAVYLKRHYRLGRWRGLLAALWPWADWSPGMRESRNLERARQLGLPVPAVVAAGEFIGPWGRLQSFLAVEELAGMLPLHEAIPLAGARLDAATFLRWKRSLLHEIARLARLLHGRRWFHKDLYLCHFYVAREDAAAVPDCWRNHVYLIDLHRLACHRLGWRLWQSKDLAQLLYSSDVPGVTARDRLRFWRLYLGADRKSWSARWLRKLILFRWRRYRAHNARRGSRTAGILASGACQRPGKGTPPGS